jgi:hypothetical protein
LPSINSFDSGMDPQADGKTTIVAIYGTRRDAEMARDHLDDEGIRALITADDAGSMHPQLQPARGVKLCVLERQAEAAHAALEDAGRLPDDGTTDVSHDEAMFEDLPSALVNMPSATSITAYLVVVGLIIMAITAGLLCAEEIVGTR